MIQNTECIITYKTAQKQRRDTFCSGTGGTKQEKNIEKEIEGKDISFHSFVVQACEYVLDQMEEDEEEA